MADARFQALAADHRRLISEYRAQHWPEAEQALAACRASAADFNLAALYDLYGERIAAFRAAPPPADWDGVFTAETK
jgi:adenylate cyclase